MEEINCKRATFAVAVRTIILIINWHWQSLPTEQAIMKLC